MRNPLLSSVLFLTCLSPLSLPAQTFESVFAFPADGSMGESPSTTLTIGPDSQIYGVTKYGGASDDGTVFKISTDKVFTLLHSFDEATVNGINPVARLENPGDGFLYGATYDGGKDASNEAALGVVFKIDAAGNISTQFGIPNDSNLPQHPMALVSTSPSTLLVEGLSYGGFWQVGKSGGGTMTHLFDNDVGVSGVFPSTLIMGRDGMLYGTTQGISSVGTEPNRRGTIFRVNADGTGITTLHDCQHDTGVTPRGAMVQATDGNFYGTMSAGGAGPAVGVLYRITPAGVYTVIRAFDKDLRDPRGDLMQATDGYLYGTAYNDVTRGWGGVFRVKPDGTSYKVLKIFTGPEGNRPTSGLVQAPDGNVYGTTVAGGNGIYYNPGVIYRIKLGLPAPNRSPIATDDLAYTNGTTAVKIPVLANDFDPEGGIITMHTLTSAGHGTAVLQTDKTILYTPDISFAGSDTFSYSIKDPQGLTAEATVTLSSTPLPVAFQAGKYNGLLYLDPNLDGSGEIPRAQVAVTVSATGAASGYILTRLARLPFSGNFASDGVLGVRITVPGLGRSAFFMAFDPGSNTPVGILFSRELWSGVVFPSAPSNSLVKTHHTLVVEPSAGIALDGYGYGLMDVQPTGVVTLSGKLPDGTAFARSTMLINAGGAWSRAIPFFTEPKLGGYFAGFLQNDPVPDFSYAGTVSWRRPPATSPALPYPVGFTGNAVMATFSYTPPPPGQLGAGLNLGADNGALVVLSGGPLVADVSGSFVLGTTTYRATAPLRSFNVNRLTGMFAGSMTVSGVAVPFYGVIQQSMNTGSGFFRKSNVSGAAGIVP